MRIGVILLSLVCTMSLGAKSSEWTDLLGSTFKGEPLQALGPLALFRTPSGGVKWMLFRALSVETIRKFHQEATIPEPAARWADSKAPVSVELIDRAMHLGADGKFAKADFAKLAEPQLILALYGPRGWGDSATVARAPQGVYERLQAIHPGLLEFVFLGDKSIISWTQMPWYAADLEELAKMRTLSRYAPKEDAQLVLMTRSGQVLMSSGGENYGTITKFLDAVSALLWKVNPANPESWPDRLYYLCAIRPIDHAQDSVGPFLIGPPVNPAALRARGISRITATLSVDASGKTTDVKWPTDAGIAEAQQPRLAEALLRSRFAPAIEHGAAVPSTYELNYVVPAESPQAALTRAWYTGKAGAEIPIASWLMLRPIPVPQQSFDESGVDHVNASGTVVLKSFEVSGTVTKKSQLNAFHSNWFDADGAASVHPTAGQTQEIDGVARTWKKVTPDGGYVDFAEGLDNCDYSVGYAWTEIEVPDDIDTLCGIGSDDGVKIWVNGVLVDDQWVRRPCKLDEDIFPLRLKKGKNTILIKIQNMKQAWGFMCRLRVRER